MAQIQNRLQGLRSVISDVCRISGAPGLSYGVSVGGDLFTDNLGFRDVEQELPATSDTRYLIGSLTKGFTASAIGQLVDEKKLGWDTPVKDILGSDFHFSDPKLTDQASIVDVLGHRLGIQRSNQLWHGSQNEILIQKRATLPHVQYLKAVQPFRSLLHYNNWGYGLAGEVVEKLVATTWGTYVHQNILEPLQMSDSTCYRDSADEKLAKPYAALDDGTFFELPPVQVKDGTLMGSSQGIASTVNDMLKWGQGLLSASHGHDENTAGVQRTPLRQMEEIFGNHTALAGSYQDNSFYGLGWVHAKLPAPLGAVGCNGGFVKEMPLVCRGTEEAVIYHQGSLAGYTSSFFLIPRIEAVIVVLSNSISLNDSADWIGQLILEALLNVDDPNDYVAYAKESAENHLAKFPKMRSNLESKRIHNTKPRAYEAYLGRYRNEIGDFFIQIGSDKQSGALYLAFQGLESQIWPLEHYHHDTFLWLMSRDENVKSARFPYSPENLYKIEFLPDANGIITSLQWKHDADGPPENFWRDGISQGLGAHINGNTAVAIK